MSIRILTKNGIENTNIDGARDNNFNAGQRSGIVKGALNEGDIYGISNTLTLEPCELRICGHRVVIDENENRTFTNKPQTATKQSLIGQIQVDGENVTFELIVQNSSTALVQDNLDINGNGTYQLEIGTFTQNTDGTISEVVRTAELISGSFDINMVENKANADLSNVTYPQVIANGVARMGAGDRVVECFISSDGNTWYRKWQSGWKVCGGKSSSGGTKEIALPISFNNILGIKATSVASNTNALFNCHIVSYTTDKITIQSSYSNYGYGVDTNSAGEGFMWEVKGY